ncbi:hypothetical protein [Chitinophaga vietnamensis]|uniref:hypothetical protein n=1 Tax=Chitinophaga vietnamensis TaxID=2593957 RepID=UPI001178BFA1|nr:hypothetical protein [Chitinophaga vietnamensis]
MEQHHVTVFINSKAYGLNITVNRTALETVYEVVPDIGASLINDFTPQGPTTFTADHVDSVEGRLRLIESEQIARVIWQEILNKMK